MFNQLGDGTYSMVDHTIENPQWEYKGNEYYLLWGITKKNGRTRVDYVMNWHKHGVGLRDPEDGECYDILVCVVDVDRFTRWLEKILAEAVDYSEWESGEEVRYQLPWDDAFVSIWDFCRQAAAYYVNCVSKGELDTETWEEIHKKYKHIANGTDELTQAITRSVKNVLMKFAQNIVVEAERAAIKKEEPVE